ncbi:hypothetical protein BCR43DRAFT_492123 [Syncephalastrum racemosum]|uniref:E3 ubiquitin-protein ligase n=1 Tax=Syncephalastrum racemosum TaxID=13706 RepID=A0A1X2HD30_SYNRA|nr:hypothetical protein BCR43DRAFT_492123 [Syncephalastrum racemosum]
MYKPIRAREATDVSPAHPLHLSHTLDLATFLWQSPFLYDHPVDDSIRRATLEKCYTACWNNDPALMQRFFFRDPPSWQDAMHRQLSRRQRTRADPIQPSNPHGNFMMVDEEPPRTQIRCGRVFRKGEPVYRCRDCGLDDTCVLCSTCFHNSHHDDHDVFVSISAGSGGCCDCGDPEAWKVQFQCKYHTDGADAHSTHDAEAAAVVQSVREAVDIVLDFILDVFSLAPEDITLPPTNAGIQQQNTLLTSLMRKMGIPVRASPTPMRRWSHQPRSHPDPVRTDDLAETEEPDPAAPVQYACIVWNDEGHAFTSVSEALQRAMQCSSRDAKALVDAIHAEGRATIHTSTDLDHLRKLAEPLVAIGVGVTIRPARDIFREQLCTTLVDWLRELMTNPEPAIRNVICDALCAPWEVPQPLVNMRARISVPRELSEDEDEEDYLGDDTVMASAHPIEEPMDVEMEDTQEPDEDEIVDSDGNASIGSVYRHHQHQTDIASSDWDAGPMLRECRTQRRNEELFGDRLLGLAPAEEEAPSTDWLDESRQLATARGREFEEKLRLDYFMLYDLRLWKDVRISLRELYIASLASTTQYKMILGKRLVRNYPRLAEAFLLKDREPENSIILISVQILTVPSVCSLLVSEYYFFGLICTALATFFLTDRISLLMRVRPSPARINCESRAFRTRRYFNAFHDLRYILHVDMLKPLLVQDPLYLRQFTDLICLFQGMNPQQCQKDTHVEYESEVWVNAFNVTLQIAKCCRCFAECFAQLPTVTAEEKIAAARTVMQAVGRVLYAIDHWGFDTEDEEEDLKQLVVPATRSHTYHEVLLPHMDPVQVIQYDVASQPVSFHQPLHWLLAAELESLGRLDEAHIQRAGWAQGFRQALCAFSADHGEIPIDKILLPIFDYPVRTLALSSQIRAGVWVRNGYNIRNQVHHYRDISLRESTYDADVFLLQVSMAALDPTTMLVTLMDRMDLVDWFSGQREHKQYDSGQTITMVEEMLYIVILAVCERASITSMSTEAKIRREIVHNLCLGHAVYSELAKRIPERLAEHPQFNRILNEVATFKAPEGLSDSGHYELRDPCYDEIDTYFCHYSRNHREEAERILRQRWKRRHPDGNEKLFFALPALAEVNPNGPFAVVDTILDSPVFLQMAAHTLYNIRATSDDHRSDTVLDEILHLIMLAVQLGRDGGSFFGTVCQRTFVFQGTPEAEEATLFDLLTFYRQEEEFKETHARVDWILAQIEARAPAAARDTVRQWRQKQDDQAASAATAEKPLSEAEKKKQAALARQKAIMAQFAQAQSAFLEQNEDLYDEEDEEGETKAESTATAAAKEEEEEEERDPAKITPYPTGTCIVCQEDVHERSRPYGILGLVQISNILRETPMDLDSVFADMLTTGPNLNTAWPDRQQGELGTFPQHAHKSGLYASMCGHLMHIHCFDVYSGSIDSRHQSQLTRNHPENRLRREFTCPLCKSLGNVLLPVLWKGKKESYPGPLAHGNEDAFRQFLQRGVEAAANKLQLAMDPTQPSLWLQSATLPPLQQEPDKVEHARLRDLAYLLDPPAAMSSSSTSSLASRDMLYKVDADELPKIKRAYTRLCEVLTIVLEICGTETTRTMSHNMRNIDMLWGMLGYTIAGAEIAIRGQALPVHPDPDTIPTGTLFDLVPPQTQTLLRILSDTVSAYTHLLCQGETPDLCAPLPRDHAVIQQLNALAMDRLKQIFAASDEHPMTAGNHVFDSPPLLADDPFMVLNELSLHLVHVADMDIYPLMRVCLLAELTKVTAGLLQGRTQAIPSMSTGSDADEAAIMELVRLVFDKLKLRTHPFSTDPATWCRLLKTSVLPFLRRTVLLMIVQFGLRIPPMQDAPETEWDHLLCVLKLPTLAQILQHPDSAPLVSSWCTHLVTDAQRRPILDEQMQPLPQPPLRVDLPTPLSLVSLPPRLDQLINESTRRICRRCGTVPSDPALCLLCGTFVCAQSFCCSEDEEGECNMHMLECGGEVGVYLLVKRCAVLVLHNENGWFMPAPYLDTHGEVDTGLRRGRPQYLNQKRYADIRKLWLQHGIPAYVARQIEATYDVGGWTTL